jgi:hypothetical protein
MSSVEQLISRYSDLIIEHRSWLKPFEQQRVKKWEDFLKSNPEGAICEAATRRLLSGHEVKVEPYEDLSSGGPDFRCTKDNKCFYVEVTGIPKDTATKKTGLCDEIPKPSRVQRFGLPTQKIFYEVCNKASQCRDLDAACILAIATLHFQVGAVCFSKPLNKKVAEHLLIGTPQITMKIDPEQGQAISDTYQTTELRDSVFIRFQKTSDGQVEFARNPISAILLCSFGCRPPEVVGALHPNPNHQFDRTLLPIIEFGRIVQGSLETGSLKVEWI